MAIIVRETQKRQEQVPAIVRHRRWWQLVIELVLLLALSVIVLEAFFNTFGIGQQEFLQPDPVLGSKHIPNKLVVWRLEGFSCDRFSSAGWRDVEHNIAKAPGTIRIALLGDSSLEGLQVPLEYTCGRVLEKLLNAQAVSLRSGEFYPLRQRVGFLGAPASSRLLQPACFTRSRKVSGAPRVTTNSKGNGIGVKTSLISAASDPQHNLPGKWATPCVAPKPIVPPDVCRGENMDRFSQSPVVSKPLRFEIINFACAGYSTGQQLIQYRTEAAKYKPDVVIALYNWGNVGENVLNQAARSTAVPRPYFYLEGKGKLREDESILRLNYSKLKPNPVMDFLRRYSRIYGVFSQTHLALSINEPRYRKLSTWLAKLLARTNDVACATAKPVLYPKQDPLKVTLALLDALQTESASNGARFVLIAFPNTTNNPDYSQHLSELARLSHTRHLSFIDLTQSFMTHPQPSSLFVQYHFSAAEHELIAKQVYAVVRQWL